MPIKDESGWKKCQENNQDAYGGCCVNVARKVMEILDTEPGDFDPHLLICRADNETNSGGITGYMAGAVASIVSSVHSRGDEFRKKWNNDTQIGNEGEEATAKGRTLNPALISIGRK